MPVLDIITVISREMPTLSPEHMRACAALLSELAGNAPAPKAAAAAPATPSEGRAFQREPNLTYAARGRENQRRWGPRVLAALSAGPLRRDALFAKLKGAHGKCLPPAVLSCLLHALWVDGTVAPFDEGQGLHWRLAKAGPEAPVSGTTPETPPAPAAAPPKKSPIPPLPKEVTPKTLAAWARERIFNSPDLWVDAVAMHNELVRLGLQKWDAPITWTFQEAKEADLVELIPVLDNRKAIVYPRFDREGNPIWRDPRTGELCGPPEA